MTTDVGRGQGMLDHGDLIRRLTAPGWWSGVFVSLDVERQVVSESVGGVLDLLEEHTPDAVGACVGCASTELWRACPVVLIAERLLAAASHVR